MSKVGGKGAAWPHLAFAVALAGSALLGRSTQLHGSGFALVWPAAGVAVLWYLWAVLRPGHRYLALGGIIVVSGVFNAISGMPPQRALLFGVATAAQAVVAHYLLARWHAGRDLGVRSFFITLFSSGAAAIVGASIVVLAMLMAGTPDLGAVFAAWVIRNAIGMSMLVSFGMLAAPRRLSLGPWGTPVEPAPDYVRRAAPVRSAPARALEAAALVLCTGAACMVGYVLNDGLPLFFITLPFGFWAAMRFPTVWAYAHAFAAGGFLLGVTLLGHGPFDGLGPTTAAYVAQLYIFVSFAVTALLALHRDETARLLEVLERSGDNARETAQLRDVVLAGMTDGIVVVDSSGRFVLQNRVGRELLGDVTGSYEDWGEAVGVSTLSGQRLMADEQPLARALRGETVIAHELTAQAGRGSGRELLVDAFPLALPGEERGGAVAVVRDVTDENVRREQLNRFVSVVAHDLKTPLTVFDGWLELLEEEGTNAAARARAVASMQSASTKMNRLITDLLAYSAAKDGETDPTVIDVGALAYAVGEPLVELAEKRGAGCVQLVVTANDLVHADRKQLEQVLDNIVGNAVKYADADRAARIEVSSRPADDPDWVVVEVADNGIGIPEAELDDIFTEFRRASNGMARASGSGLGLAICRRIVEAHGGTISARSADGAGTVFTFTLPAEPDADRVAAN